VSWRDRPLADLLAATGLAGIAEEPFHTDGWSGAAFSLLRRSPTEAFVLKRDSLARDWIARSTDDAELREAAIVNTLTARPPAARFPGGGPLRFPYLGAAADRDDAAVLMPDLSVELLAWERPGDERPIDPVVVDRVIDAVSRLHATGWWVAQGDEPGPPWCPVRERLLLLARPTATGYAAAGVPVGERFLAGWDAFDRLASTSARELVDRLSTDPRPVLDALARLPAVGLHGDLKLANVAVFADGGIGFIDWQMTTIAPVAVELGWLLVSNSASLPFVPADVLRRYRGSLASHVGRAGGSTFRPRTIEDVMGDPDASDDLAIVIGLLLRGWRKGLDAAAGLTLASGRPAAEDLAWWGRSAVEAAERRLA
jgi:hypothetical protein